jgi:hypothetical protein
VSADIELVEPEEAPRPKEAVAIRKLAARPYSDGRRVRLDVNLTPFLDRPNLEFEAFNSAGDSVGVMSVIESMDHEFELTLHLRGPDPRGEYTLRLTLFYPDGPPAVTAVTTFTVAPPN